MNKKTALNTQLRVWFASIALGLARAHLLFCLSLFVVAQPSFAMTEEAISEIERTVANHPRQAIRDAQAQLPSLLAGSNRAGELKALRTLVWARAVLEERDGLRENTRRAIQLARELSDMEAVCRFTSASATAERLHNRYGKSLALFDEAIALAKQHGLELALAKTYVDKSLLYDRLGRGSEALALLVKAYAIFETHDNKFWMANALQGIADVANEGTAKPDELTKAIDNYQRALALIDPKTYRATASDLYHNIGLAHYYRKDYLLAKQYFERGRALSLELQDSLGSAYFDFRLGLLAKDEQRFDEALAYIDQAIPVFFNNEALLMLFQAHLTRSEVLSRELRGQESLEALGRAQNLLLRLDAPAREAMYYERASEIYARFGDFEKAFRQMASLREAERRRVDAANTHFAAELQMRFDVRQKEAENALLRAQQKEFEARRWALYLALILTLVILGGLAFYLMHQVRQKKRFVSVAMRDDLTGLPNRRSILQFARLQFRGRRTLDAGLCVALIDIDHFKAFNDDYGHDVGDAVLRFFSQHCQGALRSNDRLGRFGGEEFLLVMPGAGLAQIPAIFDRMRQATQDPSLFGLPPQRRLTFSMGGAQAAGEDDTLDTLIKRADEALYRAKQAGRDRCELADGRAEHVRQSHSATATARTSNDDTVALGAAEKRAAI